VRERNRVDVIELRSRFGQTAAQVLRQAAGEEEHSRIIRESRHMTKKDMINQKNRQLISARMKKKR
jgi:hypothetical protein